jgi:hypothetical protein
LYDPRVSEAIGTERLLATTRDLGLSAERTRGRLADGPTPREPASEVETGRRPDGVF